MTSAASFETSVKQSSVDEQKNQPNTNTIIILTGGTGVIGKSIAGKFLQLPNIDLHLLLRNEQKAKLLLKELSTISPSTNANNNKSTIEYHLLDLSDKKAIQKFCNNWNDSHGRLDILMNGAAIAPKSYQKSVDKELELQFSVNVMSYLRLMAGLLPSLKKSTSMKNFGNCAKIVNIASMWTTKIGSNIHDEMQPNLESYDLRVQYRKCKAANRMISKKAGELYFDSNVAVYSCHPGIVRSNIFNDLQGAGKGAGHGDGEDCAVTPFYLATNADVGIKQSATYWKDSKAVHCEHVENKSRVQQLWDYCLHYV